MNLRDPIVGIDLGTSNSCVAIVGGDGMPHVLGDEQGRAIIPSVVSFHPTGEVLVGEAAKQRRVIDPRNTVYSFKRILGRRSSAREVAACASRSSFTIKEGPNEQPVVSTRAGEFAIPEISAIVLDHLRGIARRSLGTDVRRVVITVPANFNDAQRQATATAGEIAELVVVRVLNEPTAAALAYGHGRGLSQTVAVYDFGGGTFDVTILQLRDDVYEVLATAGDTFLGGDDIDARLVDFMVNAFLQQHRMDLRYDEIAMQRLRAAAEDAKCALSIDAKTIVRVPEIAVGEGGVSVDLSFSLTRDAFIPRVADIIERSFPVCMEALRLAQLATTQIDEVVLVGGTTRIPYVRERVAQFFGKPPRTDVNPDEAVALGAALQGASLASLLDRPASRPTLVGPAAPPPTPSMLPPASAPDARTMIPTALPPSALARVATKTVTVPQRETLVEREPYTVPTNVDTDVVDPRVPRQRMNAPVLIDVTPRALAVGTVGGWCDELIPRNSPIPIEQARVFATAQDQQTSVEVKICQGESRRFEENILLGTVVLEGLPPLPRGQLKVQVTFEINTDGILEARARDDKTGQIRSVRVHLLGAQSQEEVASARDRLRSLRSE